MIITEALFTEEALVRRLSVDELEEDNVDNADSGEERDDELDDNGEEGVVMVLCNLTNN